MKLRDNIVFLSLLLILLAVLGGAHLWIPKGELHLLLCDHHSPAGDTFFRYYTQVGEWVPYAVCAVLLFYKAGWSLFTLLGTLLTGLATQLLKYAADTDRPYRWFAEHMPDVTLPLVDGVHMSKYYSFPSGHTTTFFALFLALSLLTTEAIKRMQMPQSRKKVVIVVCQSLYFMLAALGGYSRIYLSQHFAEDILGGALVGSVITILMIPLIKRFEHSKWWNWNIKTWKNALFCKKVA